MLIRCYVCKEKVSTDAKTCPHCGTPNFLPPPEQSISVNCRLINLSMLNDYVFSFGNIIVGVVGVRDMHEEALDHGEISGGGIVICGGLPKENDPQNELSTLIGSIHERGRDIGWMPNPNTMLNGTFLLLPHERNYKSEKCQLYVFDTQFSTYCDGDLLSWTVIKGTKIEIDIFPYTTRIDFDVEIEEAGTQGCRDDHIKHGLFGTKIINGIYTKKTYRYVIKNLKMQ